MGGRRSLTWCGAVAPAVYRPPRDAETPAGSTVSFNCFVAGEPRPTVRWQRGGEPVTLTTSDKHAVTHDGSVLVIRDVTVDDSGDYECVAENMAGTTRAVARLSVWGQFFSHTKHHKRRSNIKTRQSATSLPVARFRYVADSKPYICPVV